MKNLDEAGADAGRSDDRVVGRFPDYTIRVSRQDAFLKVSIIGSRSELRGVSFIPLSDEEAFDESVDLKII